MHEQMTFKNLYMKKKYQQIFRMKNPKPYLTEN